MELKPLEVGQSLVVDGRTDLPDVEPSDILDLESGKYAILTVVQDYRNDKPDWPLRVRIGFYGYAGSTDAGAAETVTQIARCETRFSQAECVEMMMDVSACDSIDPFKRAIVAALKRRHQRTIRESNDE
ncbi:MAG: hypothetical protein KDB07_13370 [Planctomycetes bacterium]|nr:hypothetical protein [Planctomycetota bacterium]